MLLVLKGIYDHPQDRIDGSQCPDDQDYIDQPCLKGAFLLFIHFYAPFNNHVL